MIRKNESDYKKQINCVIDYIQLHLDNSLSASELSGMAGLSPYHFHRVFKLVVGETLGRYIVRKRLEKSASLLSGSDISPIKNIAYECGFNSVNVFCRNFKKYFGVTAEEYRSRNRESYSKKRQLISKDQPGSRLYSRYFCTTKTLITGGKEMNCTFEIKKVTAFNIIYCRHQGAFDQMQDAFVKLIQWAYPRGLVNVPGAKLLSVYHDDPDITEKEKLTADAALIVHEEIKTSGEIGQYEIEGGLYAVGRFEIAMEEFPDAWHAMYDLVEEHGCCCGTGHHYEIYQNNRDEHPEKKWIVDICIPVKMKV